MSASDVLTSGFGEPAGTETPDPARAIATRLAGSIARRGEAVGQGQRQDGTVERRTFVDLLLHWLLRRPGGVLGMTLDHDNVAVGQLLGKFLQGLATHDDTAQPGEPTVLPGQSMPYSFSSSTALGTMRPKRRIICSRDRQLAAGQADGIASDRKLPSDRIKTDIGGFEATGNAASVAAVLGFHVSRVVIANPKQVRLIAHAKIKTDKIDAGDRLPLAWRMSVEFRCSCCQAAAAGAASAPRANP